MKDMKPNRKPPTLVHQPGDSSSDTQTIEVPSSAVEKPELHTTHQPSVEQEGGYTCTCMGNLYALLDEQYPA